MRVSFQPKKLNETLLCHTQSGECLRVQKGHQGTVQSLSVSPDKCKLASCGDDNAIQVWNLQNGEHLRALRYDRLYERLDIRGVKGLTQAQEATLCALEAIESAPGPSIQEVP